MVMISNETLRKCRKCLEDKHKNDFYGSSNWCKTCNRERQDTTNTAISERFLNKGRDFNMLFFVHAYQLEISIKPYFKWEYHSSKVFYTAYTDNIGRTCALVVFVGIYVQRGGNIADLTTYLDIDEDRLIKYNARFNIAHSNISTQRHRFIVRKTAQVNRHINIHFKLDKHATKN